jgi:hypothetical protein
MYTNAQYVNGMDGKPMCINAELINGGLISIPLDPNNSDYQNIMAMVNAGTLTIAPATPAS